MRCSSRRILDILTVVVLVFGPVVLFAQPLPETSPISQQRSFDIDEQLLSLREAAIRLPIAAALGAALAFRPRRSGTPARSAPVIQTQIILAILGAVIMLVVGASLARAFGIVGAAGLIRYRAKIEDPKDAVVMLSTLGLGLASGVGLYLLAVFAMLFILAVLWMVESIEPAPMKIFTLKIATKDPPAVKAGIEALLRRHHIGYELRTAAEEELSYEVEVPLKRRVDRLSSAILKVHEGKVTAVDWDEKKPKK